MKILFVCDQFASANNGTTISARRFAEALVARGNEVRVVSVGEKTTDNYGVKKLPLLPVANHIVSSQGMAFAIPNKKQLQEGLEWADVAHFVMPFILGISGLNLAEEMGVPHTAAFHVQPENITFSVGMGNNTWVNEKIYYFFRDKFFNRFTHIHCPSNFIAGQLREHGYTAKLHVISNGIKSSFHYNKLKKSPEFQGKYIVTMIGRLSGEKRQDLLIEGVRLSKYADRIQLVMAGQGPQLKKIEKLGEALPIKPIINFYSEEKLHELLWMTDLYVHSADVEIEAISCIEAFASGLVPVIANSPRSATPQFALDERSLFEAGDPQSLADRIDYWLSHEEERKEMEIRYAEAGASYHLEHSAQLAEEMFGEAIRESGIKVV